MPDYSKSKNISEQRVKSHHVFEQQFTADFLKDFPHITTKIKNLWGTDLCRTYLTSLIMETRDNTRQGFHKDYASTIIQILDKHDLEFPQLAK